MDFSRVQHLATGLSASNITFPTAPISLPFKFPLIPGYGILSQITLGLLGLDIGLIASMMAVLYGLSHSMSLFYSYFSFFINRYFTSSIAIDGEDDLYDDVMEWVGQQHMTKASRTLRAYTKTRSTFQDLDNPSDEHEYEEDDTGIFNYEKWASNVPPCYEPNYGSDKFMYNGRCFRLTRERKETNNSFREQYIVSMSICCTGWSTQPIKDLLVHIKKWTLRKEDKITSIFRPSSKRNNTPDSNWCRQSSRSSRDMNTVSLEYEVKRMIVNDINEYLQPETNRWYNARGIPYRRGYLLHGPPGTGKTSLSFALAGIFGLAIYCISLSEIGLTEADLNILFGKLPRRCIVLLEDVDSAGLRREDETKEVSASVAMADTERHLNPPPSETLASQKSMISLAGLLNVIDGVASHEGRVLIMTTNRPDSLDEALCRPGRVDMRVPFTLATHEQIKEIFLRMYSKDVCIRQIDRRGDTQQVLKSKIKVNKRQDSELETKDLLYPKAVPENIDTVTLACLAQKFADRVSEGKHSPASIQNFLLTRKREPHRAVEEVSAWNCEQLEIADFKLNGSKV